MASSRVEAGILWFFLSCGRQLGVPLKLRLVLKENLDFTDASVKSSLL